MSRASLATTSIFVAHWVLAHQFSSLLPGSIVRSSAAKTHSAPRLNCDQWVHLVRRRCCIKNSCRWNSTPQPLPVDRAYPHVTSDTSDSYYHCHRQPTTRFKVTATCCRLGVDHSRSAAAAFRSATPHKDRHFTRSKFPGLRSMCKGLAVLRSRYSLGRVCTTSALRL